MSTTAKTKKRRITIEVDELLEEELNACTSRTGLGRPEIGKVGLIKVIREWRKTGSITAETLPDVVAA